MRLSTAFIPTLKEVPAEAHIPSHQLMIRSGLIRPLGAGIYSFLPMGYRVAQKVMGIIREEQNAIGGQEFHLPALNPSEIWEQTGRVEAFGDTMFHIGNREGLVLAPTHEEIMTYHAKQHINSYKDMPQMWYQIQTKFRNEPRPRSGVLRGRQFTMKDAYSLDATEQGLDESYNKQAQAYRNIYERCGIEYFIVGASSGSMGGSASQEFMVASEHGEDTCAVDMQSGYAANIEVATSAVAPVGRVENSAAIEEFETPDARTIDDLIANYNCEEHRCAKSVVYVVSDEIVLFVLRGNDALNEDKVQRATGTDKVRPATDEEIEHTFGAKPGSLGPIGVDTKVRIIVDNLLKDANGLTTGANKTGFHIRNVDLTRDAGDLVYADIRTVEAGEPEPGGSGNALSVVNAIEIGHIFKLGTKYSEALEATFLDENGKANPIIMGSYGIGVERIMACFIEQHHDENGIVWSEALAPYKVQLMSLGAKKSEEVRDTADRLYSELLEAGVEVLFDDRDVSPGFKFKDADLMGMPYQLVVGAKGLANGEVEIKNRATGERKSVLVDTAVQLLSA